LPDGSNIHSAIGGEFEGRVSG